MLLDIFGIHELLIKLVIDINAAVYQLVNYTYQIFLCIAQNNIFNSATYTELVNKIYVVLGVVIMFIIAYNLLNLVVDPDSNKGGKAVEELIKKIVTSFI